MGLIIWSRFTPCLHIFLCPFRLSGLGERGPSSHSCLWILYPSCSRVFTKHLVALLYILSLPLSTNFLPSACSLVSHLKWVAVWYFPISLSLSLSAALSTLQILFYSWHSPLQASVTCLFSFLSSYSSGHFGSSSFAQSWTVGCCKNGAGSLLWGSLWPRLSTQAMPDQ